MADEPLLILRNTHNNVHYLELTIYEKGEKDKIYKIKIERLIIWQIIIIKYLTSMLSRLLKK